MRKQTNIFVALLCLSLTLPLAARAEAEMTECKEMRGMGMGMRGKMRGKMDLEDKFYHKVSFILLNAGELGITDSQEEKIKKEKYGLKRKLIETDANIDMLALDIKEELTREEINPNRINTLIDRKYALKSQKAKDIVASYANVKNVLTDEQKEKMKSLWSDCMMGKGGMMMSGKSGMSMGMGKKGHMMMDR